MDKRFKWPLKQRAIYSDSPYHHNPSRGYQRHQHGGHPNQPLHPHQHPGKSYARQQYGYSHGGGYRKPMPPPPPPVAQSQMGGGAMAPPSSGGSVGAGADMVTLIVENNNLKRMIVLHLKLMQEQTDSLAAKDKDLDDQSARMGVVLAQNQELKQAVAKLEAANEDLRKQLLRKNQRRNDDDDDDDDHSLPPAAPQQKPIRCHAETQTVIREREQCTQTMEVPPLRVEVQPRSLNAEETPAVPHHPGVATNTPGNKRSESKSREFNGKKVSTFILQRMNQDSKHHIQEQTDQPEEQAMQTHEEQLQQEEDDQIREEVHLPEEDDHLQEEVHLPGEDDHLQLQEVQTEEVVGGDIFHDALESIEMEVVTEEMVVLEEHVHSVDANGHMEEDDEEEEDQRNSDEDDDSEEDDEDEEDTQSLETDSETFSTEDEFWQNQIRSMGLEKALAPSAHSTPNRQTKLLPHAEVGKEEHQDWKAEKLLQLDHDIKVEAAQLDQQLKTLDQMVGDDVIVSEKKRINHQPKPLPHAEVRKEEHQDWKAEKLLQLDHEIKVEAAQLDQQLKTLDQMVGVDVMVSEKKRIEEEKIAGHALKALLFSQEAAIKQKEDEVAEIRKDQQKHQDRATDDQKAIQKQPELPKAELKPDDPPKEHKRQDVRVEKPEEVRVEKPEEVLEEQKEVLKVQPEDAPKQLLKAVAPKVAAVPSTSVRETKLPKANTADMKATPAQKVIANHQSTKTQTEPVKKQRLQVKIRQYEMLSGIRTTSSAQYDSRKHKNSDPDPEPETNITKQELVNDKRITSETTRGQDQDLDDVETVKRKLQEHLKKELLSQSQLPQVALKKPIKERTVTNLIYPPPVSSTTITPAPTPSTTPTPGSTPQPALTSSIEPEIPASKSKSKAAEQIATPLTPQSNSSVSSSASTNRKTLNNCSPHTYSKATARSGKSKSVFRTASFPYTTRTWEDQEFHCDNEFFLEEADELLADNPSLEIPKWKVVPVQPSSDKSELEQLSDAAFERRHQKYVKDEIDRKCRDARYMKEQIRLEGLRMRRNQDEVLVALDPLPTSTFYPLPEDIEAIQFVNEVTVQAFGENMVNMEARDDFGVAWVDAVEATTSIARSKALAEPVATLASKKLPTTAAEARHQENHSSYVFPKKRKRQKNR
ncbi:protein male-specific lethal-1 [Drosophila biarmipes]|uniref:protein male-specific lethal-1 n=1 Tax=Drosophila biarmipes TaxID=125945 RepID=UPI0007E8746E|nr:protein male-specific lethal-1 [Drosophila biarmipes]